MCLKNTTNFAAGKSGKPSRIGNLESSLLNYLFDFLVM